jgi:hypothetical protein
MELFMRLAAHAHVGFIRGVDQAFYRLHRTNMSKSVTALMDLQQRRSVFEVVLDRYGERLMDADRLSDVVHRQLGREALWAAGRVYDRGPFRGSELGRVLMGGGSYEAEEEVDELLSFAADCWAGVKGIRLYRTLKAGKALGPLDIQYLLNQKGRWWLRRRSWRYRGF